MDWSQRHVCTIIGVDDKMFGDYASKSQQHGLGGDDALRWGNCASLRAFLD